VDLQDQVPNWARERLPHGEAVYYDAAALERAASEAAPTKACGESIMSEAVRTMMRMDAEVAQEAAAQADADFCGFLVSGGAEHGDSRQRLVTAMLLEVPLVLGRTAEGKRLRCGILARTGDTAVLWALMGRDGVLLSRVAVDACSGQCVEIPSLSSQDKLKVERIFAGHFPCEERDGYVWVYMNAPGIEIAGDDSGCAGLTVFSDKYRSCIFPASCLRTLITGLSD